MSQETTRIECPNCGTSIDVNDILSHQLEAQIRKKYQDELNRERQQYRQREEQLAVQQAALEQQREGLQQELESRLRERMKEQTERLKQDIRKQAEDDLAERFRGLQDELQQKSRQVQELHKAQAENERLKREKEELRSVMEVELEKKMNDQILQERERIRKQEEERIGMKLVERDKQLDDLKEQLQQAQRRAEQGSMQLQGEVQELAIEQWLADHFPLDSVEEIKKGSQGADCLQTVNTRSRQNCGTIYYESKRTKHFSPGWIEKFKTDIQDKNANIGVLVTEAMPADMPRMGLKDGVWICSFEEFKGLSVVLRESIIQLSSALATRENKGDKMGMLYDFLTGNEFRMQIEAIVEGFTQMQSDLASEKRAMQGIWKKREKQIDRVLLNTNHMYSSIRGIAGSAIQPVAQLELAADGEADED